MPAVYGYKTKKEFKAGAINRPAVSSLCDTSMFGSEITPNSHTAVVGPSAYDRKWYAEVWIDENGNISKIQ